MEKEREREKERVVIRLLLLLLLKLPRPLNKIHLVNQLVKNWLNSTRERKESPRRELLAQALARRLRRSPRREREKERQREKERVRVVTRLQLLLPPPLLKTRPLLLKPLTPTQTPIWLKLSSLRVQMNS
jgi:hypothetical protein